MISAPAITAQSARVAMKNTLSGPQTRLGDHPRLTRNQTTRQTMAKTTGKPFL